MFQQIIKLNRACCVLHLRVALTQSEMLLFHILTGHRRESTAVTNNVNKRMQVSQHAQHLVPGTDYMGFTHYRFTPVFSVVMSEYLQ